VDTAQLAHAAGKSILCRDGWRRALPKWLWDGLVCRVYCSKRGDPSALI